MKAKASGRGNCGKPMSWLGLGRIASSIAELRMLLETLSQISLSGICVEFAIMGTEMLRI